MPWKASSHVNERMKFVTRLREGERMTDLCREFGISRKTGYKFAERFEQLSVIGLLDQRRVPERIPHRTKPEVVELLVELRKQHPTWGAKKLDDILRRNHPGVKRPAKSTIGELLKKHGLVTPRRARKKFPVAFSPLAHAVEPNDVWCIDFKGQFRLGSGRYCYPLTVTDAATRFILVCEAFHRIDGDLVRDSLKLAFREYGLPKAIRFDGGPPFASQGLAGLSRLSVWWLRLGLQLERIEPASPQQNGRHERMHRTLKAETTRPPSAALLQQQERFDRWVEAFNRERPHEALAMAFPAEIYRPSARRCPRELPPLDYPLHDLVTTVATCGHARFPGSPRRARTFYVSAALAGQRVGLRELDDDKWLVTFMHLDLGLVDATTYKFSALEPQLEASENT